MSEFGTLLAIGLVIGASIGLGWVARAAHEQSRKERAAWQRDQVEHQRILPRVRQWQGGSADATVRRVRRHRAGLARRVVAVGGRLRSLLPSRTPACSPAAPVRQTPSMPYNPAYRGSATVDLPFDAQLAARNEVLRAAATGEPLPYTASMEDTGLIPRVDGEQVAAR